MTTNTVQTLVPRAAAHAESYLSQIKDRRVAALLNGPEMRARLAGPMPAAGADPGRVIDELAAIGELGTVATQGPRFFGFVVGGSLPVATAADILVSAWDQNVGIYALSPLVSVIEDITAGWIKQLTGLPDTWSVGFVTGGQMANFTCLVAARHHVLRAAGWNVEDNGLVGAPPIDVIVSDESHYTIFTSLRMLGLGAKRVQRIETDAQGRMRADRLEQALRERSGPCIICAQAGNVNTGAFDPLESIAPLARQRGAWLHVDGAFGMWAAVSPALESLVAGREMADSIAVDAHKWLNVPYDCGIALTAHAQSHRRALTVAADYILETKSERDPHEFTPEESRRARAVPVYAVLHALGASGLRELVERCCSHARRMAQALARDPRVTILNDVVLNQVLVQFAPPAGSNATADAITADVIARVQAEGTCWLGGTTWQGKQAMRVSVSNWSTTEADIDRAATAILRILNAEC